MDVDVLEVSPSLSSCTARGDQIRSWFLAVVLVFTTPCSSTIAAERGRGHSE
jgi:hypothetical protein